jgi:hypothetical protein
MIDCIECIFDIKEENHRLTFVPALLCKKTLEFGDLTLRATMTPKTFLGIIKQLKVLHHATKTIIIYGSGNDVFGTLACDRALICHHDRSWNFRNQRNNRPLPFMGEFCRPMSLGICINGRAKMFKKDHRAIFVKLTRNAVTPRTLTIRQTPHASLQRVVADVVTDERSGTFWNLAHICPHIPRNRAWRQGRQLNIIIDRAALVAKETHSSPRVSKLLRSCSRDNWLDNR